MSLKAEMRSHFLNDILPYWMHKTVDRKHGGFIGRIDGHDRIHKKADKGTILNARILWTFSATYNHFRNPEYLEIAHRAFNYLFDCFIDKEHGGVYWMLDYLGNLSESKKQIYAQAFAIYGFSEYYKATKNKHALKASIDLFELIEKHAFDSDKNGYFEAFDRQWNLLDDLRLSEKDDNEVKTLNTHLHILEAYMALFQIWKDAKLERQLRNIIRLFLDRFVNENSEFHLFFDEDWNSKSDLISFGHDIEGSWLMQEAAELLGDKALIHLTKNNAISMANAVIKRGMAEDGGLIYETEPNMGKDTDRHWWPQAEAIVGFVNTWQNSSDKKYLQKAKEVWEFTKDKIIDPKNGEWWFRVNINGQPYLQEDKVGPWKCPYHNGRACLEIIKRL